MVLLGKNLNLRICIFSIFSQARAAKRQANKEKAEEEKARKEDNEQQTKELLEISDENMVWKFLSIMNTL